MGRLKDEESEEDKTDHKRLPQQVTKKERTRERAESQSQETTRVSSTIGDMLWFEESM
jgi:hypothetical protein